MSGSYGTEAVCGLQVRVAFEQSPYGAPGAVAPWSPSRLWGTTAFGSLGPERVYLGRFGGVVPTFGPGVTWGSGGFDPPAWTDISGAWRSLRIRTGRSEPTASFATGDLEAELRDDNLRFHPRNKLSDLHRFLVAGKRTQVRFAGVSLSDTWSQTWTPQDRLPGSSTTLLRGQDLFRSLNVDLPTLASPTPAGADVGHRLSEIIGRAALPDAVLDAGPSMTTLQGSTLSGDMLTQAKLAVDSDAGFLWVDPRTGKLTFRGRDHRATSPRSTAVQWVFTDEPTKPAGFWGTFLFGPLNTWGSVARSCIAGFTFVDTESALARIWTLLTMARRGGTEQTADRPLLYTRQGFRSGPGRNDLECETDAQVLAVAEHRLSAVPLNLDSYSQVTIRPDVSAAALRAVQEVRIHDRVLCSSHIPKSLELGIPSIVAQHYVEGIDHTIAASGEWIATYHLSAVS